MPFRWPAAAIASICLVASAVATALPAADWVSVCSDGRALMRLLPAGPDEPLEDEQPTGVACHTTMPTARKGTNGLRGADGP